MKEYINAGYLYWGKVKDDNSVRILNRMVYLFEKDMNKKFVVCDREKELIEIKEWFESK